MVSVGIIRMLIGKIVVSSVTEKLCPDDCEQINFVPASGSPLHNSTAIPLASPFVLAKASSYPSPLVHREEEDGAMVTFVTARQSLRAILKFLVGLLLLNSEIYILPKSSVSTKLPASSCKTALQVPLSIVELNVAVIEAVSVRAKLI
ncbi:hypothetical protein A3M43_19435 [Salmonella enterica]|nr:hypothetical protein [Salmonella enterica]